MVALCSPAVSCRTWRGSAGPEGRREHRRRRAKPKAALVTFSVAWADSGRGGTPFGGARPHCYTTSGTKGDGVVPDICADVGAEDGPRVPAADADSVPRDLPPGGGKVLLLRVTCGKHRRDT